MSRWWRAYDAAVDDPKLGALTDRQHRAWFNLCCICSQNGGRLPAVNAIAFKLRVSADKAKSVIAELAALGLVDVDDGGATMHNWDERQFQSDGSTERVKRFRKRQRNVSSDVSETGPDTETEAEQKSERETRARDPVAELPQKVVGEKEPLISAEAFALSDAYQLLVGVAGDIGWHGFPYTVQTWLTQGHSPDRILAVGARLAGKPQRMSYHATAVTAELSKPAERRSNGKATIQRTDTRQPWQQRRDAGHEALAELRAYVEANDSSQGGGSVVQLDPTARRG